MSLTHFKNKNKDVEMVDISKKNKSSRIAEAESFIKISHDLYKILLEDEKLFNNLCHTAKIAGILAAKNTSSQIPLTHHVPLDHVTINFILKNKCYIYLKSSIKTKYATGLEIEALNCISTAAITIFDMLKSYKKEMIIENIKLIKKRGGNNNIG